VARRNPRSDLETRVGNTARGARILRWLKRDPEPARLVGLDDDDEEITVKLAAAKKGTGSSRGRFLDAANVLFRCYKITALDSDGAVLRVLELDPDDPTLKVDDELGEARRGKPDMTGRVQVISIDVPRLVDNIAANMKDVAAAAVSQQATAFAQGMSAMTSVVNLCLSLLVRVDQRLSEAEAIAAQQAEAITVNGQPQPANMKEELVRMAFAKAMGVNGNPPNGAPPNGVQMDPAAFMAFMQQMGQAAAQQTPPEHANGSG
jgi:hypothetical protein